MGPMSSGTPGRRSAVICEIILLTSGLSRTMPPLKSVSTGSFPARVYVPSASPCPWVPVGAVAS
jgi:hypothetical protein